MANLVKNLSEREYHADPRVSYSRLKYLKRSPAHYRANIDLGVPEVTDAMRLGTLIHSAVAGVDLDKSYGFTSLSRTTKAGKEELELVAAKFGADKVYRAAEKELARSIAKAVAAHPIAGPAVGSSERLVEPSIFFDVEGIQCKARPDYILPHLSATVDLKTTEDARSAAFQKAIFNYDYHLQGQFYRMACGSVGIEIEHHLIVAVEKTAPYAVAVYRLSPESMEAADMELEHLFGVLTHCTKTGLWPGYVEEIREIGLPTWAMKNGGDDERISN